LVATALAAVAMAFVGLRAFAFDAARTNGVVDLRAALCETAWVAYAPTNFDPDKSRFPTDASVRDDLRTLRRAGFDGLITYGADVPPIPSIAGDVGFRWMLLGVWNPANEDEMTRVTTASRNDRVLGLIVGNEGLMFKRYDIDTLEAAMSAMRRQTGKPVSTTEVIEAFFTNQRLVDMSDFITVNVHPYFHSQRDADRAADWTLAAYANLTKRIAGKASLIKETGLPTSDGADASEGRQLDFYKRMAQSPVPFAYFEAFDALFKRGVVEQSWGLFRADRTPKPAAAAVRGQSSSRCRVAPGT
jgi:exo-beta-1,3-glucanase (GH17 family)